MPPRSLFSMEGDFDIPSANDPNSQLGSLTARFDTMRQEFQNEREDHNASWAAAAQDRQNRLGSSPHSAGARARQRIGSSSRHPPALSFAGAGPRYTMQAPSTALTGHLASRRPFISRRVRGDSRDQRLIRDAQQQITDANVELERVQNSLRDMHADRSSLRRRLNKRRKIDHDSKEDLLNGFHTFTYGHYGQVEAGQLTMEIVSCDGGEFSRDPPRFPGERYRPENILTNDGRVYCTKNSRCHLLLRHVGETSFALKRIIVRAPKDGYTAPIQQGLVFVGNDAQELLKGTGGYHVRYGDLGDMTPPHNRASDWEHQQLTLLESLNDDETWERSLLRRNATAWTVQNENDASRELASYFSFEELEDDASGPGQNNDVDNCDELATAPTPPPYGGAGSSDDDADRVLRHLRERQLERRRAFIRDLSADSEVDEDFVERLRRDLDEDVANGAYNVPNPRRRATPGRFVQLHQTPIMPKDGERIEPLRTFFIQASRSEATITFDPPVSARFILLKLFSPISQDGGNIDIEYVGVQGFAGPRFFPAVQTK